MGGRYFLYAGKKELIGWRAVFIGGKKELHGDSVGFFCGKKPSPCGLVFLTAEKTLCMAVRGIFPREKNPHLVDRCF